MKPEPQLEIGKLCHFARARLQHAADNYRKTERPEDAAALVASIRADGIRVPLITRDVPGTDMVEPVDGSRRLRAYDVAGRTDPIPAHHLGTISLLEAKRSRMIANLQRTDVFWLETALEMAQIKALGKLTGEQLAAQLGVTPSTVSKHLAVVAAGEDFIAEVIRTKMTLTSAYEAQKEPRVARPNRRKRLTLKTTGITASLLVDKAITKAHELKAFLVGLVAKIDALSPDAAVDRLK